MLKKKVTKEDLKIYISIKLVFCLVIFNNIFTIKKHYKAYILQGKYILLTLSIALTISIALSIIEIIVKDI